MCHPADDRDDAAGPLTGDDEPSAVTLAGMMVLAADGMLVNLADTPAHRKAFGTCTVITTLPDHQAAPAEAVRDAYLTRWGAAETTSGGDKATITGKPQVIVCASGFS